MSAYRRQKRGETRLKKGRTVARLTPVNVNKTVEALARIIEWAKMERLYEGENPAASKVQREKVSKPRPCGRLVGLRPADVRAGRRRPGREPAAARLPHLDRTVVFALLFIGGLRVTEVCLLRWRHVDFARGAIRVSDSEGRPLREVVIVAGLRDFLHEYKARTRWPGRDDYLVPTAKAQCRPKDSVHQRILNPTIARAAELADERELPQAFPAALGIARRQAHRRQLPHRGGLRHRLGDGPARPRRRAPDDGGLPPVAPPPQGPARARAGVVARA